VPLAPAVSLDENRECMVLIFRDAYKSIEELSKKEMRLGGLRIDPVTNIGSQSRYYNNIEIKNIADKAASVKSVIGLPEKPYV